MGGRGRCLRRLLPPNWLQPHLLCQRGAAAEPQYILVYAVTAAGQEVCISGARFKHFGENAVSAAALRAADLARHGQDQASAIWIRIRMVVQDLQRGRREGETVH